MALLEAIWSVLLALSPWLLVGAGLAALLHVLLPADFARRWLSGRLGVVRAVLVGVPLPLCSCGVIPAGLGLKRDGASDGAAVGFLTATPQTGVDSVLVSASFLGLPFSLFKLASASLLGLTGGLLTDLLSPPAGASPKSVGPSCAVPAAAPKRSARDGLEHGIDLLRTIWRWLVFGVLVSAALGTWVPAGSLSSFAGGGVGALLVSLALSVPLYVCATASVPIAASLVASGLPTGAALVFLIAGPATNVATLGAVRSAFGTRVLLVYLGNIVVGSVLLALAFDHLVPLDVSVLGHLHRHQESSPLAVASSVALLVLLAWFAWTDLRSWLKVRRAMSQDAQGKRLELDVDGMSCGGCVKKLTTRLEALPGVQSVQVVLEPRGHASVGGAVSEAALRAAVAEAGFTAR
jgi:hypothetical protein